MTVRLAFGFDTTNNIVSLCLSSAVVTGASVPTSSLSSGKFIAAHAVVDFQTATVSLVLTPMISGSAVTVFYATTVVGLGPYQSRVSSQAQNSATSFANFDLDKISVVYERTERARTRPGTVSITKQSPAL